MGVIRQLPDAIASQIAAGEVVERPSSVVKELIENSLDAGATRVRVQVTNGGRSIVVEDNGSGMSPEDAVACFERHATSKLSTLADLDTLQTLGFRGEALFAIAGVSRVRLTTRTRAEAIGTEVSVGDGKRAEARAAAAAVGTRVEVLDLFYNVPARRRFLKTERTETDQIDVVIRGTALASPHCSFAFDVDGNRRFETFEDLAGTEAHAEERVHSLEQHFGGNAAGALFPLDVVDGPFRLTGFVGAPFASRRDARGQFLSVNKRPVRDPVFQQATRIAYRSALPRGHFPFVLLDLQLPIVDVDVNVHPRKTEVRFRETTRIQSFIIRSLTAFLADEPWLKSSRSGKTFSLTPRSTMLRTHDARSASATYLFADSNASLENKADMARELPRDRFLAHIRTAERTRGSDVRRRAPGGDERSESILLFGRFAVLVDDDKLVVFDAGTARRRHVQSIVSNAVRSGALQSLPLVVPVQERLAASLADDSFQMLQQLARRFGFELDRLAADTLVVRSYPNLAMLDAVPPIHLPDGFENGQWGASFLNAIVGIIDDAARSPRWSTLLSGEDEVVVAAESRLLEEVLQIVTEETTGNITNIRALASQTTTTDDDRLTRRFDLSDVQRLITRGVREK